MVFQSFRTGSLVQGQDSTASVFEVHPDAPKTFIRVIAHLDDTGAHGGEAPTIRIQAGDGAMTPVNGAPGGSVKIPGVLNSIVATASFDPGEDLDTYLVTIDHKTRSGPWRLQFTNNESATLEFNGFISHEESETLKPWAETAGTISIGGMGRSTRTIKVRNLGTRVLNIEHNLNDKFGPPDSPVSIAALTRQVGLHSSATIDIECRPLPEQFRERSDKFVHMLKTDDPVAAHERIAVEVVFPVLPEHRCTSEGCPCRQFVSRQPPDEFSCETCFHDAGFHGLPSDPDPNPR